MTKTSLSDTQLVLLTSAAQHPERAATISEKLRGGALTKVVGPLLAKALVEAVPHRKDLPVYRTQADGSRLALLITDAGLRAIGIEPEQAATHVEAPAAKTVAKRKQVTGKRRQEAGGGAGVARSHGRHAGTKKDLLLSMLRRPEGVTVPEVVKVMGWQPHTTRAAISHGIGKKLGLTIVTEKIEGRGRAYRIAD